MRTIKNCDFQKQKGPTEYLRRPYIIESKGRMRRNISDGLSDDDDENDDEDDDEDDESDYAKYFPESESKQNRAGNFRIGFP